MKGPPIKKLSPGKLHSTLKPTLAPSLVAGCHALCQSLLAPTRATSGLSLSSLAMPTFHLPRRPQHSAPPGSERQPRATARGPRGTTRFPRTAAPPPGDCVNPGDSQGQPPKRPVPTAPPPAAPLGLLTEPTHHHPANKNRRESSDGHSGWVNEQQDGSRCRGGDPKVGAPKCPVERLNGSHALTTSAPARSPAGGAAVGYRACARGHQRTAVFIPSASLAPLGEGDTS